MQFFFLRNNEVKETLKLVWSVVKLKWKATSEVCVCLHAGKKASGGLYLCFDWKDMDTFWELLHWHRAQSFT